MTLVLQFKTVMSLPWELNNNAIRTSYGSNFQCANSVFGEFLLTVLLQYYMIKISKFHHLELVSIVAQV